MTRRFVGDTVGRLRDFVDVEASVLVVTGVSGSGVGYWGSFRSDWIEVWGEYRWTAEATLWVRLCSCCPSDA